MKKGLKILFDTYWSNKGWEEVNITKEDFEIAKKEGYMFDYPKRLSHEEILKKLEDVLKKVDKKDIANAFLYSLSTRKLEYRSALGNYWYAVAIPKHEFYGGSNLSNNICYTCGWVEWQEKPGQFVLRRDLNFFNFLRYKFGGSSLCYLDYALFDLEDFLKLPKVEPTEEDRKILAKILECSKELEPFNKAGKYCTLISKEHILKTNKNELSILLDILGISGILATKNCPGYSEKFVNLYGRDPLEHTNDFSYPLNRWTAKDGINEESFKKVFSSEYKDFIGKYGLKRKNE